MGEKETLKLWLETGKGAVFFGGAGVSTESGIPDFRSQDGLYSQKFRHPPETMLSIGFFMSDTAEFYEFYRSKLHHPDARPNRAHRALARLEREGRLSAVITQNVDGLHQLAGSRNVIELHGSAARNHCMDCGEKYGADYVIGAPGVPKCKCGGTVRPDIVLYGEQLDPGVAARALEAVARADVLLVGGTSLTVYPAAGFVNAYRGGRLALINRDATPYDGFANLVIRDSIGEALAAFA